MEKSELELKYIKEISKELRSELNIDNVMSIPTLEKIVVNAGIGKDYKTDSAVVDDVTDIISKITGQKPVVKLSKIAIANFKLREGTPNGVMVTLRGKKMWDFLYKLVNITLPRVKDFRGVSKKSFDGKGNYTLGIKEHTVFPEIDASTYAKLRSLQVVICTTANDNGSALLLLEKLGMPFTKK